MPRNHICVLEELLWSLAGPGDKGGLRELWQLVGMEIQMPQSLLAVSPWPARGALLGFATMHI